jgi:hypothetical protein
VRVVLWTFALLTTLSADPARTQKAAAAQNPAATGGSDARRTEAPEEIIVRGKRLAAFRVEVELARERAYAVFNEINSTDDFDVTCKSEMRTGTRVSRQVCGARFEGRISRRAAQEYLATVKALCAGPFGLTQDCLFDPGLASRGIAAARGAENEAPIRRDQLVEEINRLAREDLRFGQAILDFYDASMRYDEERKRPRERTRERRE